MDEMLNLTLQQINGDSISMKVHSSDTPRHFLNTYHITTPTNHTLLLFVQTNQLYLDLPLSAQGVKNGDYLTMIFQRISNKKKPTRLDRIQTQNELVPLEPSLSEKHERELFEEAIRVSDVSFLLFDSSICEASLYKQMYESQLESLESSFQNEKKYPTVVKPASGISTDPLPLCWDTDNQA